MPTHYQGSPRETRALDAYIKLMRASDAVQARLERRLTQHGLTESQFGILETLFHLGPMFQAELSKKRFTSRGNITLIVDNLEKRALVKRQRDSTDRRHVRVILTEAGTELIAGLFPGHAAAIADLFAVLEPEEQDRLAELCKRLGLEAEQR